MVRVLKLAFVSAVAAVASTVPADLYVSSEDGDDKNSGELGKAVRTLQRVVALLRSSKRSSERVSVHVQGHSTPYSFTDSDGGQLKLGKGWGDNVTFIGEGSQLPLLSGGHRVRWSSTGLDGTLRASIPDGLLALGAPVDTIFVHGGGLPKHHARTTARRLRPRTPMLAWSETLDPEAAVLRAPPPSRGSEPVGAEACGDNCRGFVFADGDIDATWSLEPEALAQWKVGAFQSWTKAYHTVKSVNLTTRRIIFNEDARFAYGTMMYCAQHRYYIEGVPELQLQPGEFRISATELVYRPLDENESLHLTTGQMHAFVPVAETVVSIQAENVVFDSLLFAHGRGVCTKASEPSACDGSLVPDVAGMVSLVGGSATFTGCTFADSEGHAFKAVRATAVTVQSSLFVSIGAGAIRFDYSPGAQALDNVILGFGFRHPDGQGIVASMSPDCLVSHNDVSLGYSNGLQAQLRAQQQPHLEGPPMRFVSNHVHSNGHEDDMGVCDFAGIHVDSKGTATPAVHVQRNVFHNITAFKNGGEGIYLDDSSTANLVSKNLVFDVTSSPFLWNMNPDIPMAPGAARTNISNNVFVQNRTSPWYQRPGHEGTVLEWKAYSDASFHHNVIAVFAHPGGAACPTWWGGAACATDEPSMAGPECTNSFEDNFRQAYLGSNIYFNATGPASTTFPDATAWTKPSAVGGASFDEWSSKPGRDSSSRVDLDPVFADVDAGDYAVTAPEALSLGIEPLDGWLASAGASWAPTLYSSAGVFV